MNLRLESCNLDECLNYKPSPPIPTKFTSLNILFTILTQLPIFLVKSIFKSIQDQSELHSFFHWHSAVLAGLKSIENDVEALFSSALYFRVALRASKK
jgi:hypothetical protein